jgi:hypothetical protein
MRTDLLMLAFNCSLRDRKASLTLNPKPAFGFTSAAKPIPLPQAKPRAVREHFVMSSIRSREVGRSQRSSVRNCEDAFKALDVGNGLLSVHSALLSNMGVAIVKRGRAGLRQLLQDVVGGSAPYRVILVYDVSRWERFQDR